MLKTIIMIILSTILLAACASYTPEKAPCDQYGSGCGMKVRVNQW